MTLSQCFFLAGSWRENANKEHLQALALELVRRGHQVVLIVDGQRRELVNPSGNPAFYTWPSPRPTGLADALFLAHLVDTYHPDCLVSQFGSVNLMMGVGLLKGVRSRLVWYHTISAAVDADALLPTWKIKVLRWRKKLVLGWATHLVANSSATCRDLMQTFAAPAEKIRVFYNNLPDPQVDNPGLLTLPRSASRLVCVGRMHLGKGQSTLIRAARQLKDQFPNLEIDLIGSGEQQENYRALARELGVSQVCRFPGSVPHNDIFREMASASLLVVPSLDEAFGYVCIEAMSVGTPVIASRVGGLQEIVRDGIDGFLVPPGDADALAHAIRTILENPAKRGQMGANARQRFLDVFEARQNIQNEADWLEKLLDNRP